MDCTALLDALAQPGGISGEALATRLGITRSAVWKQVRQLRAMGVDVDAQAGRGYRLGAPLQLLDVQRVHDALAEQARTLLGPLVLHVAIDSTNSELLRRAALGAASGEVCLAEFQHAGRGRRGRAWQSPLAANVYLSVLWRFDAGLAALAGLSLAAGVAVRDALATLGVRNAQLKWPNDVVVGGRKLAGLLVEVGGEWNGPCHAVVGVGVNWRMSAVAAAAIEQPWTDLAQACGGAPPPRERCAVALLDALLPALARFARDGLAPFRDEWLAHDALAGARIDVDAGWSGVARGIDGEGRLRVLDDGGREHVLAGGEVSVRRRGAGGE